MTTLHDAHGTYPVYDLFINHLFIPLLLYSSQLNDEQCIEYAVLIVFPCLYGLLSRYREDLIDELSKDEGFVGHVRKGLEAFTRTLEMANENPQIRGHPDVVDLQRMVKKLNQVIRKPKTMVLSRQRRSSISRGESKPQLDMFFMDNESGDAAFPFINTPEDVVNLSQKLQKSFIRYIMDVKSDEEVEMALRTETSEVAERLTFGFEKLARGPSKELAVPVFYLRYGNIMYCLLQYVLDSIQSKPNPSDATLETFSFKTNVSTEASFTIIKFLRKVLTFIMFNAENFYDESLSMTSMSSSFRYNRLMLARAKVERMPRRDQLRHKSAMKKARFSKVYQDMSVQGIPQAIEFGVVDLIVKLVRNGMSSQVWRKACKLGRELLDSFPADRIPLQERLFTVLSNPHNAPFFYGVKAVFSQAKLFIQRRAEKVDAKLEIDESYTGPIDDVCLLLSFLQKLCEGHFLPLQKLFLAQPQNIKQINILQLAMDLLHSVLKSFKLARMGLSMIEKVVTSILSFFTEVVQGPCKPNQNWLLQSTALGFCNKILRRLHDFFDQQTDTYRISFKDEHCEKDFRVEDVFTNKPKLEGGLSLPDSVGDAVQVTLGGASKLGKKLNDSITDLKRSAIRGNLAKDFSDNAGKMMRKSIQLLMIDDEEEDDESFEEQDEFADKWEAGQQVYVRRYAQDFTNLRTGRAMYNWKKGTVVRRNPGNFFVFHYDHDREKQVQLGEKQLDSLLNNIEMKMVDLILGLLEGRADPMKFRSAFRKMKESLLLFFMKDIWVAASVDAYEDSLQEISITKSKAFRRTRMGKSVSISLNKYIRQRRNSEKLDPSKSCSLSLSLSLSLK